MFLPDLFCLFF